MVYLSYILDKNTPTYGDKNRFEQIKKSDMDRGDIANDTSISTTVHIGTHIDMPYHFYKNGETIESFDANFWFFNRVLFLEIKPDGYIVKDELIKKLDSIEDIGYEILVVKTGICYKRESKEFWAENYGFHPDIYNYLVDKFPKIRVVGFDSISVSSLTDRMLGRESHKRFLNPRKPILLLEDMDLREVNKNHTIQELIISPLRISKCDGLPCTVFGILDD